MKHTLTVTYSNGDKFTFTGTVEEIAAKAYYWGTCEQKDNVIATEVNVTPTEEIKLSRKQLLDRYNEELKAAISAATASNGLNFCACRHFGNAHAFAEMLQDDDLIAQVDNKYQSMRRW